jgi:CheY-like chemotaxis protein/HPt (histidine-containing phosphotransfer) domain-containing protein
MSGTNLTPRVLIVDDDPVSLRFLEAAVAQCDCIVTTAASGNAALAAHGDFDLLLIDRRLPDIDGVELLRALRERGIAAPAIATSAEIDTALAAQLRATGFVDLLEKPASVRHIIEIVVRHLSKAAPVLLDDVAALDSIGGDAHALHALRSLLARELEELERDLTHGDLARNTAKLGERLHRLRASCGFCGAPILAAAAARLAGELRVDTMPPLDEFLRTCRETAQALRG